MAAGGGKVAVVTLAPRLQRAGDRHLRSARDVLGYYVHAHEDDVGHVADFLFGDAGWAIRHVVVALRHGLSRRRVLVPVGFVSRVGWDAGAVSVALPVSALRSAPGYDPAEPFGPDLETRLAGYYGPPPFRET